MSAPRGAYQRFARGVRWGLFWVFVAFGIGAGSTWYFRETVFRLLLAPGGGGISPFGLPIFTSPTEMLSATIHLSIMGGAVAAFPVATFRVFRLASPFLDRQRRRFVALFLPAVLLCYMGGAAFAYFVMLPTGLRFLLRFGEGVAVPVIRLSEYMSLVTTMLFWLGIVFELPLVMFLLAKLRGVSHKRFRQFRKYVPVAALVLSAIITPTFDIVNQLLVAVPIWVLYEVGLALAWLARPREAGHRSLWQRARPKVAWVLRRLWIVVVGILLAVVAWQLVMSSLDGRLNVEDWHRVVEDAGRFWEAVRP